jgi:hypothetical protein
LDRLLKLNHQRYDEASKAGGHGKKRERAAGSAARKKAARLADRGDLNSAATGFFLLTESWSKVARTGKMKTTTRLLTLFEK